MRPRCRESVDYPEPVRAAEPTAVARAELALKLKPLIAPKAIAENRQREIKLRTQNPTREAVAKIAGVGTEVIQRAKVLAAKAPAPSKLLSAPGKTTINAE